MKGSVSLNISFFCFEKLLLTWTSNSLWKQASMSLWSCWRLWNISTIHFPTIHFVCGRLIVQNRSHWIRSDITQNKHLATRQKLFDITNSINSNFVSALIETQFEIKIRISKKKISFQNFISRLHFKIWKMKKF